jgi:serine/threonine protein kinase
MSRFVSTHVISSGLKSVVHRCIDHGTHGKQRVVAVKLIGNKERAFEESSRLLMVGHRNVISLLDIVEGADSVGIVMPLVRMDLRVFMKRVDYRSEAMLQIKLQTMKAVHHVHTRGLLHLDIKPENIGIDFGDGAEVQCVLLDFGSAVVAEEVFQALGGEEKEEPRTTMTLQTTQGYYPPELGAHGILSSACDIYSAGVVFGELVDNNRQRADPLESFRSLSLDMRHEDFRRRPSSKEVLVRLGDRDILGPLLLVSCESHRPVWTSPIASTLRQCNRQCVADTFINDRHSTDLQKLVTLVRSADVGHIRDAFWLLFETSVEEAEGKHAAEGRLSVLSVLHYFDSRIHLAREHGFFYAKSLDVLSRMPYFVLTDDMKLHLWKVSSTSFACERPVLRCLASCWAGDDTLLPWCLDDRKRWGVKQEPFADFIARFVDDWDAPSVEAAQSAIRRA